MARLGDPAIALAQAIELLVGQELDVDQLVPGAAGREDQLVELEVEGLRLAVLGVPGSGRPSWKVTIVVPALMTSCQLLRNPQNGPASAAQGEDRAEGQEQNPHRPRR